MSVRPWRSCPPYVPGRKLPGAVVLASNESPYGLLPGVAGTLTELAAGVSRYPDMSATSLVQAIAGHHGVEPERIAVGAGSSEVCGQLLHSVVGPGDEVYLDNQGYTLTTVGSTAGGTYVPVDPTQILNNVTVGANSTYRMTPLGQSPVPLSGVQAVSVSVTALSTGTGTVRVYGAGDITPADATLDYAADTIEQNFAIAKIGANTLLDSAGAGVVNINNFGFSPVTISVAVTGCFTSGTASTTGALVHALTPSRIADTVSIAAGDDFALPVLGQGGIATSKPTAVGLNLTADSAGAGVITVSSAGLTDTGFNTVAYRLQYRPVSNTGRLQLLLAGDALTGRSSSW